MTWFVELIHRDGSVLSRNAVLRPEFSIGRGLENDLVVDDPYCAASHASLVIQTDGRAVLHDLGSCNGIVQHRKSIGAAFAVTDSELFRLGQTNIRIRNSQWPVPDELVMPSRAIWPFALAALALVLMRIGWDIWLKDVGEKSPPYLYGLVAAAAGLCVWSGVYALLGRLISGTERFFTHLLIACGGYLLITLTERALQVLSFSTAWLWPLRIESYVTIVLVALLVRAHLRVADPRHWPVLRWALYLVAGLALVVPAAQLWISSQRLTNIQTLKLIEHPILRLAKPMTLDRVIPLGNELKLHVDKSRSKDLNIDEFSYDSD